MSQIKDKVEFNHADECPAYALLSLVPIRYHETTCKLSRKNTKPSQKMQ